MKLAEILKDVLPKGRFWTHSKELVSGCTKVSPGCLNCWSEAMDVRFCGGGFRFNGEIIERPERMVDILPKSSRRAPRVWTYWNDVFHEGLSEAFHCRLFNIIDSSPDYHIVCTKRPERAAEFFRTYPGQTTPANLIIMVTMEDQDWMYERRGEALHLSRLGLDVGLLIEPMLGPVDIFTLAFLPKWIICGPENGRKKRPFDELWARDLQRQAATEGVPFYFKPTTWPEAMEIPSI